MTADGIRLCAVCSKPLQRPPGVHITAWRKRKLCGTACRAVYLRKHGEANSGRRWMTSEYAIWQAMIQRCSNPSVKRYPRYGGRGIEVCAEWRRSFQSFLKDMGRRPSKKHSLDRIDNDGNYEPSNCRWATTKTQANNTSWNRVLTIDGTSMTIAEWAYFRSMKSNTIVCRLRRGWPAERAVSEPVWEAYAHRRKQV